MNSQRFSVFALSLFSCEFCKILQNNFFIEPLETTGNIRKSQAFYRSPLFSFSSKNLFYHGFPRFSLCGQLHWRKTLIVTSQILQTAKINPIAKFLIEQNFWDWFIEIDLLIIHVHFGGNQPPVSLKIKTVASLIRETWVITTKNSVKKTWPIHQFLRPILCWFLLPQSRWKMFFKIGVLKIFAIFTLQNF